MQNRLRTIVYFLASIFVVFVLILTNTGKHNPTLAQISLQDSSRKPVVILLDNSGSMGRCSVVDADGNCVLDIEKPYRIDVVKDAIGQRIAKTSMPSSKIGLVEFGNWQSYGVNQEDKRDRCEAVETLVLPEVNNQNKVVAALPKIQANDAGVTPIGFAINAVVNDIFRKYNLFPGKILLISDGNPNCIDQYKMDLCDIIASLAGRGVELEVDIIGYKANGQDSEFRKCADKYAMVRYLGSADNRQELDDALDKIPELSPPLPTPTAPTTVSPTRAGKGNSPGGGGGLGCIFRNIGVGIVWFFCILCAGLLLAIILSLFVNNSGWTAIMLIKSLDPAKLTALLTAMTVLTGLMGNWATSLTAIPCG